MCDCLRKLLFTSPAIVSQLLLCTTTLRHAILQEKGENNKFSFCVSNHSYVATDFVEPQPSLRIQLQSKVVELMHGRIGEWCDEGRRLMARKVRHEYKLGHCQPIKVTPPPPECHNHPVLEFIEAHKG